MPDTLVRNVGRVVTGDLRDPAREVDSIYVRDGVIDELDSSKTTAGTVIDARGRR